MPGVTVSGKLTSQASELRIGGAAAAHGTLRLGPHKQLDGVLGGERVQTADAALGAVSAQTARFRGSYR